MKDDTVLDLRRNTVNTEHPIWEYDPPGYAERRAELAGKSEVVAENCEHCGKYCMFMLHKERFEMDIIMGAVWRWGECHKHTLDNKEAIYRGMRNGAYKHFEMYLKPDVAFYYDGRLSRCIVNNIRSMFSSPSGNYVGYPYTLEEYQKLIISKQYEESKVMNGPVETGVTVKKEKKESKLKLKRNRKKKRLNGGPWMEKWI